VAIGWEVNGQHIDLSRYRVIAFSTHALMAGEVAGFDQPALVLSNPELTHETDDGVLKLEDLLALKLNADWVVLSACNIASPDGSADEAISGLGPGFFYAGAQSVLVSNWAVDSRSACLLTTVLFRRTASHPGMRGRRRCARPCWTSWGVIGRSMAIQPSEGRRGASDVLTGERDHQTAV
jgi:CHAT domain-containing protein